MYIYPLDLAIILLVFCPAYRLGFFFPPFKDKCHLLQQDPLSCKYQEDRAQKDSVIRYHLHSQNRLQAQAMSSGLGLFLSLPSAVSTVGFIFLKDGSSGSWHCILPCQYPGVEQRLILLELSLRSLATLGRAQHTPFMSPEPKLGHMPIPGLVENKGNQSVPPCGWSPHPRRSLAVRKRRAPR